MIPNAEMRFHHFGLASARPQACTDFLVAMGYQVGETIYDPAQNVHLAMAVHPRQPAVEIVSPGPTPGPITALISTDREGLYHVCYECDDIDAAVVSMKQNGLRVVCISPPLPALLFGGRSVSFFVIAGFGLIEVLGPPLT